MTSKTVKAVKCIKSIRAWASVGPHGGIFVFAAGPVANMYPGLLEIYAEKATSDLVEVEITPIKRKAKK